MKRQKHCRSLLIVLAVVLGFGLVAYDAVVPVAIAQGEGVLAYVPVATPCRVVRTQGTAQTHLNAGASRDFFSFGSAGTISAQGGIYGGITHAFIIVGGATIPPCTDFAAASESL